MTHILTRRQLVVVAGGALAGMAAGTPAWAQGKNARAVYPVSIATYSSYFVADRKGFFKDEGLNLQLIQGGSGTRMREIVASGQGDIGIGDITHPLQMTNRGRAAKVLSAVDTRAAGVMIVAEELFKQGVTDLAKLAAYKRPDGGKPIVGVSSLGGTSHVWSSYFLERMNLDRTFTFRGLGTISNMLGALKSQQIDCLVLANSALKDAETHGWGRLLFDMGTDANWNKYVGGKVPVSVNFALQSTIERDPAMVQALVNALLRSVRWIAEQPAEEVLAQIEPFVGSTSREANLIEIGIGKLVADPEGRIDAASFERGGKVYFREMTDIKPVSLADAYAPQFIEAANKKLPR